MGLSKPLSFIAQHLLPGFTLDSHGHDADPQTPTHPAVNTCKPADDAESAAARRIRQQHPYHPHYQHNLVHTDTPSYSTPPSLSSSPTHSSPSSTVSSSSSATHSGLTSPTIGHPYSYQQPQYPYHHQVHHPYPYQLQSQQPPSAAPYYSHYNNSRFGAAQTLGPKGGYSYHRNQTRYQRRKAASTLYYYVDDDDDMMVGYEGHLDDGTHMSEASTPMALPQQKRQNNLASSEARSSHPANVGSHSHWTEPSNPQSPPLPPPTHQPYRSHLSLLSNNNNTKTLLPAIAETSTAPTTSVVGSTSAISAATATATSRASDSKTAQRSLRRIAQCSIHSDDWCSAKAGQYTRSYADSSFKATSYGEGRRMRRM